MKNKGIVFSGMGFELVGIILGGLYLGEQLDKKYNLGGLGTAALSFLVLAGWLWHLVIMLKKYQEDTDSLEEVNDDSSKKNLH